MESTSIFFVLFFGLVTFRCSARDTITFNANFSSENGETLVSAGKTFELGFFNPGDGDSGTFIGTWYYNVEPRTVVWVANRDLPLLHAPGFLAISNDGNVKLSDLAGASYFHTDVRNSSAISSRTLKLLDSGNLVLFDDNGSGKYLWQSFTDPSDTFLPGMLMNENIKLVSWMDPNNPVNGNFSFQEDQDNNKVLKIMETISTHWRSSADLPIFITYFLANCTSQENRPFAFDCSKSRLLMNSSGEIQFYSLESNSWSLIWSEPHDECSVFRPCGRFGLCSIIQGGVRTCECLPGFDPILPDDISKGCERKVPTCNEKSKPDRFLSLKMMNLEKPDIEMTVGNKSICRQQCLSSCQSPCEAYYYVQGSRQVECFIWTSEPNNLQEYGTSGHDLYIRLSVSAIESTSRDCEPCGKYIIPYPLSRGHDCGDPSYYTFSCDKSTGQLVFSAMSKRYQVIDINSGERRFVIQANDTDSCSTLSALQFNELFPFQVTNCYEKLSLLYYEIAWRPPLEPICNSSYDCQDWPESACSTQQGTTKRCFCNSDFRWDGKALKCISVGPLTASPTKATAKPSELVIIGTTLAGVILLAGSIGCFFYRIRKGGKNEGILGNQESNERDDEDLADEDGNTVDLAYFSLESILEATQNFSDSNKLGQGGFGPVYKGIFPGGQEIAVKRLLSQSGQGMDEFRNEVVTIAKLQHRNLVRLLGYCIKGPERLLLYEYMPNTSLDTFMFDQERCILLDWSMRFDIILGITRGLLYLHQDSRLRIIHRDLKTSNILLDEHMNPKISDFGLARIFAGKEIEANTMRVVGTYGYMSPEYAQAGFYSVKSDVFSFGVIVLEIISGKKNTGFYNSSEALSLLGYAWRLWEEGKAINLVDERISKCLRIDDVNVIKCINIGLLCVQDDPSDRPTMSNVLHMLGTEVTTTLPSPKEPGFVPGKFAFSSMSASTSSLQAETRSVNKMSITLPEGR